MEFTLTELKFSVRPSTKPENYQYFENLWCRERMHTCQDFLWKYNKRDVVSNLEAMQKMSNFYHEKGFDMLKLRCAFPNLDKILCAQTYWCKVLSPQRERQRFVGGKSAKIRSLDLHCCWHVKRFSMRLANLQTFVYQWLGLRPTNLTHTLCVNPSRENFLLALKMTNIWKPSNTNKTSQGSVQRSFVLLIQLTGKSFALALFSV